MRRIHRLVRQCFLTMIIVLSNSCGILALGPRDEMCITPEEKLAYPVGVPPSSDRESSENVILGDWRIQASLPETQEGENAPQIVARFNEVWVLYLDGARVLRYRTDSREWKTYNTINSFIAAPRNLFLAEDGTLWGIGTISNHLDSRVGLFFLSRYNESTDQFEFVKDIDGLLDNLLVISSPAHVVEDNLGLLWFFGSLPGGDDIGLYSFDPSSQKAEKHLSLPTGLVYAGPAVSRNGNGTIWFYSGGSERQLIRYSATIHQAQPYLGLLDFDQLGHIGLLYFDRDGKLWLDNKGWLDVASDSINPVWYKIIPSPVFLTDKGEGLSKYGWLTPINIYQSSNSWLWFTTIRGTIWLDPKREEWCMFTTGSSPIVEDNNGNLWIAVFGKLYQYQMER